MASHYKDKTSQLCYLYNKNLYTWKDDIHIKTAPWGLIY